MVNSPQNNLETRWYEVYFQPIARFLSRIRVHFRVEGSAIQAGYTLIKHTFQDIARYSRMEYQFLDKFSVFQVGRTYLNTTFQIQQGFYSRKPILLVNEFSSFQAGLSWIMCTFQDIARHWLAESQLLGEISVFQVGLTCIKHICQAIVRLLRTESQNVRAFSSLQEDSLVSTILFKM